MQVAADQIREGCRSACAIHATDYVAEAGAVFQICEKLRQLELVVQGWRQVVWCSVSSFIDKAQIGIDLFHNGRGRVVSIVLTGSPRTGVVQGFGPRVLILGKTLLLPWQLGLF